MSELKTKPNKAGVKKFLDSVTDDQKRADCYIILDMMKKITKAEPVMWGKSIVGFGDLQYKYASGREGDWFVVGFSPRKANISIYLCLCDISKMDNHLADLGKHKTRKSCLYVNKLEDINTKVLEKMVKQAVKEAKNYGKN